MVERKEVEALLQRAEDYVGHWPPTPDRKILAALCRAWLAVEAAPVGEYEHVTESVAYIHFDYETDASVVSGQRVRIIKEEE